MATSPDDRFTDEALSPEELAEYWAALDEHRAGRRTPVVDLSSYVRVGRDEYRRFVDVRLAGVYRNAL